MFDEIQGNYAKINFTGNYQRLDNQNDDYPFWWNLRQFPLTKEDIHQNLQNIPEKFQKERISQLTLNSKTGIVKAFEHIQ